MKIRIKFGKYGALRFVGHLDILRYFQKVMRRADVDIRYSAGFSPHQIMSFAQPLGLGVTSDGEYVDIEVNSTESSAVMVERINAANVEEFVVYSYRLLPDDAKNGMSVIAAADYEVRFREGHPCPFDYRSLWETFLSQEQIWIEKEGKKKTQQLDIRPLIFDSHLLEDGIFMQLSCGSAANLKPETVMQRFYAWAGYPLGAFDLLLHRKELYADLGPSEDAVRTLVTLESMGKEVV